MTASEKNDNIIVNVRFYILYDSVCSVNKNALVVAYDYISF